MSDLYTKAVLTVIAFALIVIAVRDMLRPATAQAPMHVILDNVDTNAFAQMQFTLYPLPVKAKQ
jgi:hypothetical protein